MKVSEDGETKINHLKQNPIANPESWRHFKSATKTIRQQGITLETQNT